MNFKELEIKPKIQSKVIIMKSPSGFMSIVMVRSILQVGARIRYCSCTQGTIVTNLFACLLERNCEECLL